MRGPLLNPASPGGTPADAGRKARVARCSGRRRPGARREPRGTGRREASGPGEVAAPQEESCRGEQPAKGAELAGMPGRGSQPAQPRSWAIHLLGSALRGGQASCCSSGTASAQAVRRWSSSRMMRPICTSEPPRWRAARALPPRPVPARSRMSSACVQSKRVSRRDVPGGAASRGRARPVSCDPGAAPAASQARRPLRPALGRRSRPVLLPCFAWFVQSTGAARKSAVQHGRGARAGRQKQRGTARCAVQQPARGAGDRYPRTAAAAPKSLSAMGRQGQARQRRRPQLRARRAARGRGGEAPGRGRVSPAARCRVWWAARRLAGNSRQARWRVHSSTECRSGLHGLAGLLHEQQDVPAGAAEAALLFEARASAGQHGQVRSTAAQRSGAAGSSSWCGASTPGPGGQVPMRATAAVPGVGQAQEECALDVAGVPAQLGPAEATGSVRPRSGGGGEGGQGVDFRPAGEVLHLSGSDASGTRRAGRPVPGSRLGRTRGRCAAGQGLRGSRLGRPAAVSPGGASPRPLRPSPTAGSGEGRASARPGPERVRAPRSGSGRE